MDKKPPSMGTVIIAVAQSKVGMILSVGLVAVSLTWAASHFATNINVAGIVHVTHASDQNKSRIIGRDNQTKAVSEPTEADNTP